ncbi:hypothetical protein EST38_g6001 [Candolleomyces aberdarensis]|uniref:Uncharacterized protein n=1 Tax=Candolleomyces aberdarensis TaxID=2316362 RepID=A0A4Q2DJ13_9AGAR|nr:hypothetical protein EST38_g6001 [Candolleomyces aberdarensis]
MSRQTVQRPGPRLHRLPRRLDYMLVPAPLDLSLDSMTEKSPLPAIIVTPSSPTHSKDFAIAFLAPPKKPSVAERACKYVSGVSESVVASVTQVKSVFWPSSPIALPLSAPATTTEFKFGSYSNAKRNSRILMVVLSIFFLVFCHMLAHFFAYASMAPAPMTSDTVAASVGGGDFGVVKNSKGVVEVAYGYLNKLEIDRWLGWMARASHSNSAAAAATAVHGHCDISANGWTVAAGSELQGDDAIISYWDPRNPTTPLRTHTSTHSDDVTVVSFAPPGYTVNPASSPGPNDDSEDAEMASASQLSEASVSSSSNKLLLLTGSTDGLLNVSDAYEEDEDEAVILTANWGCSIAQAGWVGEKGEGVWAGSDMETFSTWSSELDPILDFDIREPGVHGGDAQWVTDYLVGCHSPSASIPKLSVFVGSNEGDVALISTPHPLTKPTSRNRQPTSSSSSSAAPWYLQTAWTHQHVGVVRALYYDQQHQLVVTGGEDAKLHIWRDSTGGALYEGDDDVDMDVDDAAPTDDEELARRRVKSSRKRDSGSDEEDEAMTDRTSYPDGLRATYTAWISARGFGLDTIPL